MKLKVITAAVLTFLLMISAVSAQKPKTAKKNVSGKNVSGTWTLDMNKSKVSDDSLIRSVTMTVNQTAKELKVETKTDFQQITADINAEKRGGGFGGSPSEAKTLYTYALDGKETDFQEPDGIGNAKLTAEFAKTGQLKLTQTRQFNMPTGNKTLKTIENWMLSPDGKTLTVRRETDVLKGDFLEKTLIVETKEMIFVKN